MNTEGPIFGAFDAYAEDTMDEGGLWGLLPGVRSFPWSENAQLRHAVTDERNLYTPDFVSNVEQYLETIAGHAERQANAIERGDRSLPPPSGLQE